MRIATLLMLVVIIPLVSPSMAMAQDEDFAPHFVYLRGGSASSVFLFYTHTLPNGFVLGGGGAKDPYSDYYEGIGGAGFTIGDENVGSLIFAAVAKASDSWYAQAFAYPWVNSGRWTLTAFTAAYQPLQERGVHQLLIDPANLFYWVGDSVAVGGAYTLFAADGLPTEQGAGPAAQFLLPGGSSVTVEYFHGLTNYSNEVRATLQLTF